MSNWRITPQLNELGSDDKISLICAIDMALRNTENPIVIKKFEKMRSKLLLTKDGKNRKNEIKKEIN
ncbi:hypothetical protein EB118_18540 [bacterium]|nr:hypothetical protein [bacterium]